ncbi:MAG: MBL fold metallo-hydrolase [Chloroflexota bacterium]|nr:MBL fold metallo-hydrolase [Chloroflexota bacterium]
MDISWLGHACFQLRGKHVTLITDPFSPQLGYSPGKLSAHIVTISHNDPGHNYVQGVAGDPYVVRGPGEYEVSDVLITGVAAYHDNKQGQERGRNTIYMIHMDDLTICHLGDVGHILQEKQVEEVADADILLIPIGGHHTINATQAAEVISQIEPRIVIPMHYRTPAVEGKRDELDPLDKFCREMGVENSSPQPKLSVTRNNLPIEMQVVILAHRG